MFVLYVLGFLSCAAALFFASKIVYHHMLGVARNLGASPFLVSLLLVAFSTSIPELFVGVFSALEGTPALALGDILGSNIVGPTFIAGLMILLSRRPLNLPAHLPRRQVALTFLVASLPVFLMLDGVLSRLDGALLMGAYALYLFFAVNSHLHVSKAARDMHAVRRSLLLFAGGAVLLLLASAALVWLALAASAAFLVSPFIVGVFALAFSTSIPELVFAVRASLERRPELSAADIVGSTAIDGALILGFVALVHPITIAAGGALITGVFGIGVYVAFFLAVALTDIAPARGAILLALYFLFVSFNFFL